MSFYFEFLNTQVSHLSKLGMIIITFKCQNINVSIIVCNFHYALMPYLAFINSFWPLESNELHDLIVGHVIRQLELTPIGFSLEISCIGVQFDEF